MTVIDIRPDISADRILTNQVFERKIDALTRAADKIGLPIMIALIEEKEARIFCNQLAFDEKLAMVGALDVAREHLSDEFIIEVDIDEEAND